MYCCLCATTSSVSQAYSIFHHQVYSVCQTADAQIVTIPQSSEQVGLAISHSKPFVGFILKPHHYHCFYGFMDFGSCMAPS